MRTLDRALLLATALAFAGLLAGCSAAPAGTQTTPAQLVGKSLDRLVDLVPADSELLIQDASPRVGLAASYDGVGLDRWTVIALCADEPIIEESRSVEVAVVPSTAVTDTFRASVLSGAQADAVDCEGRGYTATRTR